MLSLRRFLPLSLCLLAVAPLLAVPDSPRDDPPPDGRKHAQLRQTARDFLALPAESQERMRRLDHALHTEVDRATRTRLLNVLYRYADWLERLPEPERQRVTEAPDRATRLKRIKEIREEQWVRRQPQAVRNWLDALRRAGPAPPAVSAGALLTMAPFPQSVALACALSHDPRALAIHKLREDGRKRRQEWQLALRHWDELKEGRFVPARLADLPAVKSYVEEYLYPRLSKADKERLEQAEGHWPDYPYTLVELADNHPPALPATLDGIPLQLPTRFAELPRDLQARLQKKSAKGVKGGVAL
ncbi:MAG TPA: hypothetical protein VEL76_18440, partial [Gemmataceae bacterium]|nr:hypothetical protein [Gemmataceae bacterium]